MTTLTIKQSISFKQKNFNTIQELFDVIYEELLEQKLQYAKKHEKFIDF
jgi:hypothetical protein